MAVKSASSAAPIQNHLGTYSEELARLAWNQTLGFPRSDLAASLSRRGPTGLQPVGYIGVVAFQPQAKAPDIGGSPSNACQHDTTCHSQTGRLGA